MKLYKKLSVVLLAFALVILCAPFVNANGESAETLSGDYVYTVTDGKATITRYVGAGGNILIPSMLDGYPVVEIGYNAFGNDSTLTSVAISEGIVTIGESAFYWCSNLTSVTLPAGITTIGSDAFYECEKLTTINFPGSLREIGRDAFSYCDGLTNITLPDGLTYLGDDAFYHWDRQYNQYENGSYLGSINNPYYALVSVNGDATSCQIHPDTKVIAGYAFSYCTSLSSVTIPEGVVCIPEYAFSNCTALTSINLPSTVTEIRYYAFDECIRLKQIALPDGVQNVASSAFSGCLSMTYNTFGNAKYLGNGQNDYFLLVSVVQTEGVTSLQIHDSTKVIAGGMLSDYYYYSLDVTIPVSVTAIGDSAFSSWAINKVYYTGSQEQWTQVFVGANNDALKTVVLSSGTISQPNTDGPGNLIGEKDDDDDDDEDEDDSSDKKSSSKSKSSTSITSGTKKSGINVWMISTIVLGLSTIALGTLFILEKKKKK